MLVIKISRQDVELDPQHDTWSKELLGLFLSQMILTEIDSTEHQHHAPRH